MEDTAGFQFSLRADVSVYVDGFVNQKIALPLTHVVQSRDRIIALRTVEELIPTRVEAEGLSEVIFLRLQNRLQR